MVSNSIDEGLSPRVGFSFWVRDTDDMFILYKFNNLEFEDGFNQLFKELALDSSNFTIGESFNKQLRIKTLPNYKVPYYTRAYE